MWLDNRKTLAGLENTVNGLFTRYSALAINTLGRQNLTNARWNVVRPIPLHTPVIF